MQFQMISKLQPQAFLIIIETFLVTVTAQSNLALKGLVVQKSTLTDSDGIVHSADLAIQGPANNEWTDGCSSTLVNQTEAWWALFLPELAYITNIVFYLRAEGCFKGTWGNNCTAICPSNCISNHCYPENGYCVWGCDPHNCVNNKCDIHTGICTDGCTAGRAGQFCSKYNLAYNGTATQNPVNSKTPANLAIDGNRTNGVCSRTTEQGFYLQVDTGSMSVVTTVYLTFGDTLLTAGENVLYCSNTSNSWVDGMVLYNGERPTKDINVYAVCRYIIYVPPAASGVDVCEIEIGGCPLGRYGVNCEHLCYCNGPYDLVTGQCELGCLDGWTGERCDRACNNGYFGGECNKTCSENCLNPTCNRVSGECNGGCNEGWKEYDCTKECGSGYFGLNCANVWETCFNQSCDIFEGNCRVGCNDGYRGRKCETPVSAESSASIRFGFFIGGSASMFVVLLIIWMVINARRQILKKQESRKATCIDNSHSNSNEQHYDDIMKMEGLSAYQDLAKQTVTVSNDYDQINNAYVNQ